MRNRIAFVAHEFGRYPGHGGIASYLKNQVESLIRHTDLHIHVFCIQCEKGFDHPRVTIHKLKGFDAASHARVTSTLMEIKPLWVEVAEFGGLCNDYLIKRAMGQFDHTFPVITNHHTGCQEIWEWGTGIQFLECTDPFLHGMHAIESAQSLLSDANVSVSTFLTNYLQKRISRPFLAPLFPHYPLGPSLDAKSSPATKRALRILCLGRFEPRKRQDLLIDAAVQNIEAGRDIHVTFVGNSVANLATSRDFREECFGHIPAALRHHFTFLDFSKPEQVKHLYQESDVFCIPSPFENFPTTALEASGFGLPVLGSTESGLQDMFGSHGLYYSPFEAGALAKAILKLSTLSSEAREHVASEQFQHLSLVVTEENTTIKRHATFQGIQARRHVKSPRPDEIIVINDKLSKYTARAVQKASEQFPNIRLAKGSDVFTPSPASRTAFIHLNKWSSEALFQTLMDAANAGFSEIERHPLAYAKDCSSALPLQVSLSKGLALPFVGTLSSGRNHKLGKASLNEHVFAYLAGCDEFAYQFHKSAVAAELPKDLRNAFNFRLHPFQLTYDSSIADSRPHIRLHEAGIR